MKTCKDCEHYKNYDFTPKKDCKGDISTCARSSESPLGPLHDTCGKEVGCNDRFVPIEKPKTKCEKCVVFSGRCKTTERSEHCKSCLKDQYSMFSPIEKPKEPDCKTCRYDQRITGKVCLKTDRICDGFYNAWQPIEKPGQATKTEQPPKEKWQSCSNCKYDKTTFRCMIRGYNCFKPNPPKKKEKTMLKKVRHWMRMAAIVWLAYGIYKICVLANPVIYKVWHLVPLAWDREDVTPALNHILPWLFTLVAIVGVIAIGVSLNRLTKWFFGDK